MHRRWPALATVLTLALAVPQAALASSTAARRRLGRSADDSLRPTVTRTPRQRCAGSSPLPRAPCGSTGTTPVGSTSSARPTATACWRAAPAPARPSPSRSHGTATPSASTAPPRRPWSTRRSAPSTGGTVVRSEQTVDGVPVFGGQVVMSLDDDQDVVSIDAATTDATEVHDAVVSEARARRTALAVGRQGTPGRAGTLSVTDRGRQLYDPALVHVSDPGGVRPVWQFEVTQRLRHPRDGAGRHRPRRGRAALQRRPGDQPAASVTTPTSPPADERRPARARSAVDRTGGRCASPVAEVNEAYDNLGVTSDAYAELDGIDLTETIGTTVAGPRSGCWPRCAGASADDPCPYPNAFWDGTQMVFGTGYADADDVVGHELTHGYVERNAGLFYLHQSGRSTSRWPTPSARSSTTATGGRDDDDWRVGEDLPGGAIRSMRNPTAHGHPDRMTSATT